MSEEDKSKASLVEEEDDDGVVIDEHGEEVIKTNEEEEEEEDEEGAEEGEEEEGKREAQQNMGQIGGEFQKLIEMASKIKSAQPEVRQARQKWELMNTSLKNTLLYQERDAQNRQNTTPFAQRFKLAESLKEQGNKAYRDKDYEGACAFYQRAAGVFHYAVKVKTKDGDQVDEVDTKKELGESEREQALKLEFSCLSNQAACWLEMENHEDVIAVCRATLSLEPQLLQQLVPASQLVKPLVRSARSHVHLQLLDEAIALLTRANKLVPSDTIVEEELNRVKQERQRQIEKDKKTFGGMFERGHIYKDVPASSSSSSSSSASDSSSSSPPNSNSKDKADDENNLTDTERFMRNYVARYRRAHASTSFSSSSSSSSSSLSPQQEAALHAETMAELANMRAGAAKFGVDLQDKAVQEELERLQQRHLQQQRGQQPQQQDQQEHDEESTHNTAGKEEAGEGRRRRNAAGNNRNATASSSSSSSFSSSSSSSSSRSFDSSHLFDPPDDSMSYRQQMVSELKKASRSEWMVGAGIAAVAVGLALHGGLI